MGGASGGVASLVNQGMATTGGSFAPASSQVQPPGGSSGILGGLPLMSLLSKLPNMQSPQQPQQMAAPTPQPAQQIMGPGMLNQQQMQAMIRQMGGFG